MSGLSFGERNQVYIQQDDGTSRKVTVYDHVNVIEHHYINSVNGYERTHKGIASADNPTNGRPDAVTARVAKILRIEFSIDVESEDGIEVVDMSADNVTEA